jgi:hypothetical protein
MSADTPRRISITDPTAKPLDAEQCRLKAEECRALARTSNDPHRRTMLEHMAETWERLARSFQTGR